MSRISLPKLALVLVLATFLATPSTGWSAGRRFSNANTWTRGSVTTNLMVAFWNYVSGLWGKEGCGLDPSGICKADAGCGIDPSGVCGTFTATSPTTAKEGCGIDPNGRCVTAPAPPPTTTNSTTNQDAGCGLDPNGVCQ